jgi:CheY-like chemotaxis protein
VSTILVVDSDGKALAAMQRRLRRSFETHIALGPRIGLQRLAEDGPYAVVLAEQSMEDMDGIEFLTRVRASWPQTTRILVSRACIGVADLVRLINEAKAFHLLPASCDEQTLLRVVEDGARAHESLGASAGAMHEACSVFAKAVHEIICWVRGDVRDVLSPMLPLVRGLSAALGDPEPLTTETAFMVSVIGLIALPQPLLEKVLAGRELSEEERLLFAGHPGQAVEMIRHLPILNHVAEVLRGYSNFLHLSLLAAPEDESERPPMPVGSAILALVMEYRMALYAEMTAAAFLERMRGGGLHSPHHLAALAKEIGKMDREEVCLPLDKLQPGMVLARAVEGTREGREMVLVPEGYELSRTTILFLRQSARHGQVTEPVHVRKGSIG